MNATARAALLQGLELHDAATDAVGERTLEILERRRRMTVVRRRGWLVRRMLLAADVIGLTAALLFAEWFVSWRNAGSFGARAEVILFFVSLPGWVVAAKLYGLYDRDEERADNSTADEFAGVFHVVTVCTWLFWVVAALTGVAHPTAPKLMIFWSAAVVFVSVGRAVARTISRRSVLYLQNALIVGAGDVGQLVAKKLLQHPEYGINLVGFVDESPKERREDLGHLALLGPPQRLPVLVEVFDIERVIVAFSNDAHEDVLQMIRDLKELDQEVQVDIVPRFFELVGAGMAIHSVEGLPLVALPPLRLSRSSHLIKRTLDLTLACAALLVILPLLALVALAIKVDSDGPVFFRQVRMGAKDRTFQILKFRSMVEDADLRKAEVKHLNKHAQGGGDPRMFKVPDDPRVTRVGYWLRRLSIDELPQLINVIRGEMSLVGPRPLILDEHAHVTDWGQRRLALRPGITGLWQVLGRDGIGFAEMLRLDYLYVTTWSLRGDLALIIRTIPSMLRGA